VSTRHKRNRAATIKASDFPLPPRRTRSGTITQQALTLTQVDASGSAREEEADVGKATRRTRSGTVMQQKMSFHRVDMELPVPESDENESTVEGGAGGQAVHKITSPCVGVTGLPRSRTRGGSTVQCKYPNNQAEIGSRMPHSGNGVDDMILDQERQLGRSISLL
jgi:hypothetical protein